MGRADVLEALGAGEHGLSADEAAARLSVHGPNRLPKARPPSLWTVLVRQFRSPLIYILGIAGAVSLGLGETVDASFIFGILILNAAIGGFQEWRAERSSHALQQLIRTRATVVRDDEPIETDAEALVPGDVVWLESGSRVPSDLRLLRAHGLEVDESLLTGESVPVQKDDSFVGPAETPVGDRLNMVHAGSVVARGRAKGVVVETGSETMVGRLARAVTGGIAGKPPLLLRLERFTRVIAVAVVGAAAVVGLIGVFARGFGVGEMFMFAVALAVSAIPEGLPVALTVALAVAMRRMARRGVIVRKLAAVEGLGSCTLIASDKTGTLTCNQLTVRRVELADGKAYEVTGEGYAPHGAILEGGDRVDPESSHGLSALGRVATLCNEARLHAQDGRWSFRGDPTDVALLSFGHKAGFTREDALDRYPQIDDVPFEPERRFAATFHESPEGGYICLKGAPERVLSMCAFDSDASRAEGLDRAGALAREGYRVLALADGAFELADGPPTEPSGLRWLGLVAMMDPLRPGAKEAVAACRSAGVLTTMVTGDHPITALAIARDLGIATDESEVVTGMDLAKASEGELVRFARDARVFARVAPEQKLSIVEAARTAGHFVAVTGDGVNDAPALRSANIGVAMGRSGTDVARDAAALVITDDNFATIVAGVEEGRIAYDNLRKVIYLLISTGAAEVVLITLALSAGLPLPLLPAQLLWLNLVTNGIQDVALAFEPGEGDALARPPRRPTERIFDPLMLQRTFIGALVIGGVAFGFFWWTLSEGASEPAARNTLLLLMVLFENVHIGNSRSETRSMFRHSPLRSPILFGGAAAAFLVHLGSMYLPGAQVVLGTAPVPAGAWPLLVGLALTVAVAIEIHKWFWRRTHGRGEAPRAGIRHLRTSQMDPKEP